MLILTLATAFSAAFGLTLRWAGSRRCNMWVVGMTNYVVATIFQLTRHLLAGGGALSGTTWTLGIVAGLIYGLNFWLYFRLIAYRGVAITTAIVRLGVVIPVLGGLLLWRERPEMLQGMGVALAVLALPLLTVQPDASIKMDPKALRFSLIMLVSGGVSMLTVNAHGELAPEASGAAFLTVLFASAFLVTLVSWWGTGKGGTRRDIGPGVVLGLVNALSNAGLVAALQRLPGVVVFPFYSAVGLVMVALAARWLWQESPGRLEMAGMGTTLLAVVLMNLS